MNSKRIIFAQRCGGNCDAVDLRSLVAAFGVTVLTSMVNPGHTFDHGFLIRQTKVGFPDRMAVDTMRFATQSLSILRRWTVLPSGL
jgi:hypothetical protein